MSNISQYLDGMAQRALTSSWFISICSRDTSVLKSAVCQWQQLEQKQEQPLTFGNVDICHRETRPTKPR